MLARSFWLIALAALMNLTQPTPGCTADAVNVATPSIVIFAIPYWIAEQKGYFKDENIEPTLAVVASSVRMPSFSAIGRMDVTSSSPGTTSASHADAARRSF